MSSGPNINKGVELMLRRDSKKEESPEYSGLKVRHTFSFLKKKFNFRFEFTWEGS